MMEILYKQSNSLLEKHKMESGRATADISSIIISNTSHSFQSPKRKTFGLFVIKMR